MSDETKPARWVPPSSFLDAPPPLPARRPPDPMCETCRGRGRVPGKRPPTWEDNCPTCRGEGRIPGDDSGWFLPYDPAWTIEQMREERDRRLRVVLAPVIAQFKGTPIIGPQTVRAFHQAASYALVAHFDDRRNRYACRVQGSWYEWPYPGDWEMSFHLVESGEWMCGTEGEIHTLLQIEAGI